MTVRLQKFLADAGVASRRAGEQFIREGRVFVNGQVARVLGTKVDPERDRVVVDGKPLRAKRKLYLALNKPRGCVCSRKDEHGRRTIYDLIPREWDNVQTVGRLDYDSEGLIFLTNDGEFSLHLTHPRYGVRKKYVVIIEGLATEEHTRAATRGLVHEGERLKAERARLVASGPRQSVVELELAEGKNREVRRLFEAQGLRVRSLQRTQIGRIRLGELRAGRWRTLTEPEIKSLLSAGAAG